MEGTAQTGGGSGSGGGGASQGGGSQGGGTTVVVQRDGGGTDASRTAQRADAVQGIVDRLVQRYGTAERALDVLAGENHEYRDRIRTQDQELAQLRAKVPADGALVLSADQKKVWDAIVATNVPIDKVAERIKRAGELETAQAEENFGKLVDQGAGVVKFNATVLRGLLKDKGYTLELRDVIVDGKSSKVPYIRKSNDDKAAWELLTATAERDFKDYLPALKTLPQGGASGSGGGTTGDATQGTASHEMPTQSSTSSSQGGGGSGSVVDQTIKRMNARAERPNPLKPAPAAKT